MKQLSLRWVSSNFWWLGKEGAYCCDSGKITGWTAGNLLSVWTPGVNRVHWGYWKPEVVVIGVPRGRWRTLKRIWEDIPQTNFPFLLRYNIYIVKCVNLRCTVCEFLFMNILMDPQTTLRYRIFSVSLKVSLCSFPVNTSVLRGNHSDFYQ